MSKKWTPPTPEQIRQWQKEKELTDSKCADLAGLSNGSSWRKYKSKGLTYRPISFAVWYTVTHRAVNE